MKKRLLWIDSLRGVLILLVVLGHCIQDIDPNFSQNYIWNLIYSFHMAAFMAISGYLSYKENLKFSNLKNKLTELLIPFLLWAAVFNAFSGQFFSKIYNIILHPDLSFWFLWVLFFINVLFYSTNAIAKRMKIKQEVMVFAFMLALILIMVVLNFRLFGYQFISFYFIFFALGFYMNKYFGNKAVNFVVLAMMFLLWFAGASFWDMHEVPFFLKNIKFVHESLLSYAYRSVVAILGVVFLIFVSPHLFRKSNMVTRFLAHIGTLTLGIYVIHLGIPFYKLMNQYHIGTNNIYLFFLIRLVITLIIVKLISLTKYSAIFLGKYRLKQ